MSDVVSEKEAEEMLDVVVDTGGIVMRDSAVNVLVLTGGGNCGKSYLASEIMRFAEEQCGWETHVGLEGFDGAEVLSLEWDGSLSFILDLVRWIDRVRCIDGVAVADRYSKRPVKLPKLVIIETGRKLGDSDLNEAMSQLSRHCRCVSFEPQHLVVD